jgi:hypothetical protein
MGVDRQCHSPVRAAISSAPEYVPPRIFAAPQQPVVAYREGGCALFECPVAQLPATLCTKNYQQKKFAYFLFIFGLLVALHPGA